MTEPRDVFLHPAKAVEDPDGLLDGPLPPDQAKSLEGRSCRGLRWLNWASAARDVGPVVLHSPGVEMPK